MVKTQNDCLARAEAPLLKQRNNKENPCKSYYSRTSMTRTSLGPWKLWVVRAT